MNKLRYVGFLLFAALWCSVGWNLEADAAPPVSSTIHPDWRSVPLTSPEQKGLQWLVSVQGEDGGWGQDGGRAAAARQGISQESSGNDVANTCIAALALLRSGAVPGRGPHGIAVERAVRFVLGHVERAQPEGLAVTTQTGTQIQRKLGPYIDTFLAAMLLSEVDGQMIDVASQGRVRAAVKRCVAKIESNQQRDGSWNIAGGWAPVIGTSLASRGLYRAQSKGIAVDKDVLRKVDDYTRDSYDAASGKFKAAEAGAGVELYQAAQALEQASRSEQGLKMAAPMARAAGAKLADARFVGGFGSMGGEEFVSYLNVSDSLARIGGQDWTNWNAKIKDRLVKLQNEDGTWAGHHCITGRVACTAAAILTLTAERISPKAT